MPVYRQDQFGTEDTAFTGVGYSVRLIFSNEQHLSNMSANNISNTRIVNVIVGTLYGGRVMTCDWWSKINPRKVGSF